MEKPIITTNSVGCKEVVENEKNGFLIPAKNSGELAKAIARMIELPYEKRLENYYRVYRVGELWGRLRGLKI